MGFYGILWDFMGFYGILNCEIVLCYENKLVIEFSDV
jgi:hypothetical protein